MRVALGPLRYDVTTRALVMGILNRTPDSFFDSGVYFGLDDLLRLADQHVATKRSAWDAERAGRFP